MQIEITHHVETSEPDADGNFAWHYEYDLFRFTEKGLTLVARSYTSDPEQAHFLRVESSGRHRMLTPKDLSSALLQEAKRFLGKAGKEEITWLGMEGYAPLP